MPESQLILIKLGGSLLTLPDLRSRLATLLARRPEIRLLLIAGGGRLVDVVREWDATYSLGDVASHDLALEALNVTANLLARLIPNGRLVTTRQEAAACWSCGEFPVLKNLGAHCGDLPRSWDVTSDSLAAQLARRWEADQLWLLKSTDLPAGLSVEEASRRGLVDNDFPRCRANIPHVLWCNLRSEFPKLQHCF